MFFAPLKPSMKTAARKMNRHTQIKVGYERLTEAKKVSSGLRRKKELQEPFMRLFTADRILLQSDAVQMRAGELKKLIETTTTLRQRGITGWSRRTDVDRS